MNGDEIIDITDNQEPLGEETIEISSADNNDVDIMAENVIYAEIPSEIIEEMQEDIAELQLESGASVVLSVNTTTYVLTLQLKNAAETVVSTTTVDLPLESVVVNGRYDSVNKKLILVLENGTEIEIPISDLINGLQEEITSENKLDSDLVDDTNQTNKFVTAEEKELISDIPDMQEFDKEVNEILPTVTGAGTELSLDGTKETRMEIDLKGNTEQASTEGKNLFNANGTYYTRNENTTLSISGNEITITNTSTVGAGFAWWNIPITSGQNYTISYIDLIENPENTNNHLSFKFNENPITEYTSDFTDYTQYTKLNKTNKVATAEATSNYVTIVLRTTVEAVNKITGIQLEQGSTATDYEPYTGGIPSPNPDYPQDIHTVTGNNTISVCGKNLLKYPYVDTTKTNNGITYTDNGDGTITISGTATANSTFLLANQTTQGLRDLLINKECFLSGCYTGGSSSTYTLQLYGFASTGNGILRDVGSGVNLSSFENKDYNFNIAIFIANGTTINNITFKPQLDLGSTATSYEPYQATTYPINLGTMELCKIGDYQDYIYKSEDKWYKHSEIGKMVLDGSESNWRKGSTTDDDRFIYDLRTSEQLYVVTSNSLCNRFSYNTTKIVSSWRNNQDVQLVFDYTEYGTTTLEQWENWLSTHNLILYQPLVTPTDTEITDTTLIAQLNTLDKAKSYDTQTNITQINSDLPFILDATAKVDINLADYVKNTDYATNEKGGVTKNGSGFMVTPETGVPYCSKQTYEQYLTTSDNRFIGKGTLENVIAGKNLDGIYYGTCSTGATTQEKAVTCAGYRLQEGNVIYVKMTNGNTYNGVAKLNVNGTGAKDISKGPDTATRYYWTAGELVCFVYDGTNYIMTNKGVASGTYYGITKLITGATNTSTSSALTPNSLNQFSQTMVSGYATYSSSSTYAVGDRVRANYGTYECITAIETAESWDATHWKLLDPLQKQIDDNKTYSTTETVVGTFLGKPLYRKVVPLTAVEYSALADAGNNRKAFDVSSYNIDFLLRGDMTVKFLDSSKPCKKCYPMHLLNTSSAFECGLNDYNDGIIKIIMGSTILNGLTDCNIILEYTKTTD